jgi:hypothetical protein
MPVCVVPGDVSFEEVRAHDYAQCSPQQATHQHIYQLQQQLNQAVHIKQQDIEDVFRVSLGSRLAQNI